MSLGSGLSERIIREFHGLCNHAYDAWITHRTLFDDNPRVRELDGHGMAPFFSRLFSITQEYSLHQIAKLHDPAVQMGRANLTLEYMLRFGAWDGPTTVALEGMKRELDEFARHLKSLRNRSLSHNDLEAILSNEPLGAFPADTDKRYFTSLQQFVNTAHDAAIGGPLPFHVMAEGDVFMFLKRLLRDGGQP
jgi:hypothetical protein